MNRRGYTTGFVLSIILTLAAYAVASRQLSHGWTLVYTLAALAVTQLVVQLVFFLHLGHEAKPRWNLMTALFALMVVFIVVFGSLWIMKNLSYNHNQLSPQATNQYITKDEGYQP